MKEKKVQKRVLCLLSVLLVGVLLLSSMGCIEEKEKISKKKMKIPPGWKVYENKEWGYRIKYPIDWVVPELSGVDESYFIVRPSFYDGGEKDLKIEDMPYEYITYQVNAIFSNQSLNEIVKNYLNRERPMQLNFRCEELTNVTIDSLPAKKVTVTYELKMRDGKLIYCKQFFIFVKKGNRIYQLTCQSASNADEPYEKYEEYLDTVDQMTKSFQFV
jgi:hypothetical protein